MVVNWIVDIVFMLLFATSIIVGVYMGFIKTVAKPVKFVLAIFLAYFFAANFSAMVVEPLIAPPIRNQLMSFLTEKFAEITVETVDTLPTLVKFAAGLYGVDLAEVASGAGEGSIIETIVANIVDPSAHILCTAISFVALFFVAKLLLTIVFAIVDKVIDNGIIGVANKIVGAVFTGMLGFIICWALASVFELVIHLPVFAEQSWAMEFTGGFVYKFLKSISPIDLLLSF